VVSNPVAVLFILTLVVFVSFRLTNYRIFQKIGVAFLSIFTAMVLSNVGFLPGDSPTYDFFRGPGIDAAIVLILLNVDIRSIKKAGPSMLKAAGIGAVASAIGGITMGFLLYPSLGSETWKLAGQYTGTYTGGGINFAAVGKAVGTKSEIFSAGVAADVIVGSAYTLASLALLAILALRQPTKQYKALSSNNDVSRAAEKSPLERSLYSSGKPVLLTHIAALATITFGTIYLSDLLATWLTFFPNVIWITTIALILGQVPGIKKLYGGTMLGNFLLLLFLTSNGARSVVKNIMNVGPSIFIFALGTVIIHATIIYSIGRLLKNDTANLVFASNACVGGSSSALVLGTAAQGKYTYFILPGVIVGLLGYAVGNYSGLAVANLMKNIL
jgi:uncharacterized membrane protein